jgi:hypothetical protein
VSDKLNGPWLRLAANYWSDPRILTVTGDAELVYVHSLAYAKAQGTGGAIEDTALPLLALKAADAADCARQLVAAGLWERTAQGWRIPPTRWRRWQSAYATASPPASARHDQQSARAFVRWHKAGYHGIVPRIGCPLCVAEENHASDEEF